MINMPLKYDGKVVKEYSGDGSIEAYTTGIIGSSDYFVLSILSMQIQTLKTGLT